MKSAVVAFYVFCFLAAAVAASGLLSTIAVADQDPVKDTAPILKPF